MTTTKVTPTLLPSLRSRMGDWWYYITFMTFAEVKERVKKVDDIHEKRELKTWIQRELRPTRLKQISDYLVSQKQHFFNALVAGIYRGEPEWYPIKVGTNPATPSLRPNERAKTAFGFLYLDGEEEIFAIDGQHRVEGIKEAIGHKSSLEEDEQCVIFVAHKETDEGRSRTRRLFSTLNKYARPVSKGELVALSEDDTFAIVARKLIDEYKPLHIRFVPLTKTPNIPTSDKTSMTTVLGLYDLIRIVSLPSGSREKRKLEIGPPEEDRVEEIFKTTRKFWEALRDHVPEIEEVTDSNPDQEFAGKHRHKKGGHVLFRALGLKAFAQATRALIDRGMRMDGAVERLSQTTLDLNTPPWPGVLWNAVGQKMITKNPTLAYNLFLYMANEDPDPETYDILSEYRQALDVPNADLDEVERLA